METVRLQHATHIPRCFSLPPNEDNMESLGRGEDLAMIQALEDPRTSSAATRELEHEVTAARKLILVMSGLLVTWLPYFIWLPVSTLMVSAFRFNHPDSTSKNISHA